MYVPSNRRRGGRAATDQESIASQGASGRHAGTGIYSIFIISIRSSFIIGPDSNNEDKTAGWSIS